MICKLVFSVIVCNGLARLPAIAFKGADWMKKPGSLANQLLEYIVLTGAIFISLQNPKMIKELYKYLRKEVKPSNLKRSLGVLEKRNLIQAKESAIGLDIKITKAGEKYIQKLKINKLKIEKPIKWDKMWRLVVFDVPEKRKRNRDYFAAHLKTLGFYRLQDSVFVHPYDCKDEIIFIADIYLVSNYVNYGVLTEISKECVLKKHFHLN